MGDVMKLKVIDGGQKDRRRETGDGGEKRTCYACAHSYMEPSGEAVLICGHKDAGTFGLYVRNEPPAHCGWEKFEQHSMRNADGSLKKGTGDGGPGLP